MLIFILEDEENIRELEAFALKNSGWDTECFESSGEFYKALSKQIPDLILLDIMLPGDDGLTVLTKLREDERFSKVPVIIVSAKTTELDRVKGLDLGADDYLCKPFGVMELVSRVRARLRNSQRRSEYCFEEITLSVLDSADGDSMSDEIDLVEAAMECREQLEPLAAQKGIDIRVSGEAEKILGCRTEIHELIYNLADNAIKYNRSGGNIEITVSGKTLTVEDTGIGIPSDDIPRIFERFYRADKSRSRARGGTGLGLSIVRHIAQRHDAQISVESTVNVGTKITVIFK